MCATKNLDDLVYSSSEFDTTEDDSSSDTEVDSEVERRRERRRKLLQKLEDRENIVIILQETISVKKIMVPIRKFFRSAYEKIFTFQFLFAFLTWALVFYAVFGFIDRIGEFHQKTHARLLRVEKMLENYEDLVKRMGTARVDDDDVI